MRLVFTAAALLVLSLACPASAAPPKYGPWQSCRIGGGGFLQHVVFCPSDAKRIYLTSDVGGLYRSDDRGVTWRMLHAGCPPKPAAIRSAG